MKKLKGLLAVALLAGCSSGGAGSGPTGTYQGDLLISDGIVYGMEDIYIDGENKLELKKDNVAVLALDGGSGECKWQLDGENFALDIDGDMITGTLKDDVITLSVDEDTLEFVKEGSKAQKDRKLNPSTVKDYWEGDWYGFWIITDGTGDLEPDPENPVWYDCCAQIVSTGDNTAELYFWDEDGNSDDLTGAAAIKFIRGNGEYGRLVSTEGWFFDADLVEEDWMADPAVEDFDNLLYITGYYVDPEDDKNTCTYDIIMRPWGTDWTDMIEEDDYWRPYAYEDWYLPLIQEGKPMPNSIGE